MKILEVENVTKTYGIGETQVKALDNVSFSVDKGEFVAIVGPSGSGKSTLLHILGCVDEPTSGKVIIDQTDVSRLNETQLSIFRRRQVGLVYQFYNLIPVLNVRDNITLPLSLDHRSYSESTLQKILHQINLADRQYHLPSQLSGGQQQRVSIGRALMTQPSILLADEPTGNLDRKNSEKVIDLLKHSQSYHSQTLILITHDMDIAMMANRIIMLEDGKIIKDQVIK